MTFTDLLPTALTVGGVMVVGLVAYLEVRMRKVFAAKDDLNGLGRRVDIVESDTRAVEAMAEATERRVGLLEAARASDKELLAATLSEPLRQLGAKFDAFDLKVSAVLSQHGQSIVKHERDLSALGRGVDELKRRVDRMEDSP